MVEAAGMLEISPVDCKLIVGIQLRLQSEVTRHGISGIVFQHEHPVIDGWAVPIAEHWGCLLGHCFF